jgi:hypothetical protein
MGEPQAVEVLCHEWVHALAWNLVVDRLINAPNIDPVEPCSRTTIGRAAAVGFEVPEDAERERLATTGTP